MISFNPLAVLLPAQTAVASATAPSPIRAPVSASLLFAASVGLASILSGCGRTGLLDFGDTAPADAGTSDAAPPDAGTDAPPTPVTPVSDLDCDGVLDLADNCPLSANANQQDSDGDGIGDVCDNDSVNPDSDGDGVLDGEELWVLGTDHTKADTDGDGLADGEDSCPATAGTAVNSGCLPSPPTCHIEAIPHPMTLCDGTFVEGFRILWDAGNASDVALKEGSSPLTRRRAGQVYVYPMTATLYALTAESPFGNCQDSVTIMP
jgi:hypothetical protein